MLLSLRRWASSSSRKETSSWNRSLDALSRREAAIKTRRGRNWTLVDREPRIDRRGAKVYHSRMEARLRDAVDEVLFEWMRADGVLRSVEYEIKLSPDKRQALMYWSIPKPLESFKDVFGQLDDGASLVEKYLNRRVVQLRYDVTRRLNFKFSPEFLIFRKKKKGVVVDHTKKRKPRFGGELDDDEEDEYDE